ncbi:hypothetical protein EDD22DRAFT_925852 [Suillus occidentalis]|nr:hypothetical protein EDD22DRAFT_925852 [Suillus occidentalis]
MRNSVYPVSMTSHRLVWRDYRRLTSGGRHGPRSEFQLRAGESRCLLFHLLIQNHISSRDNVLTGFNPHLQDGRWMQVLRNSTMRERSLLYPNLGKNLSDESSVERQRSMGGWLGVEGSHSFMPFKVPPIIVRCTASTLCIRNAQIRDWRYVLRIFIYVRATLMLLTNIQQRPALPLPSTYFFQTAFELQNTPDIPISTMSFQLGMRRYGRLIGLVLIDIQYRMRAEIVDLLCTGHPSDFAF